MAATASVKIVKQSNFRGSPHLWSNRYHFTGGIPTDNTKWTTFCDAIVNNEKTIYDSQVTIVQAVGYDAGSDVPVFTKTYSQAGTSTTFGAQRQADEVVALIRYATTARTPKNHPVYLFNYYHNVLANSSTAYDTLNASQQSLMQTYAGVWVAGISDGTVTHVRAGPNGATAVGYVVEANLTHRDFPR
jgi:hypothetical protein